MKLHYVFHSCFALECQQCVVIFDYWLDPLGIVKGLLDKGKTIYVLVSHFHEDHFNPKIFDWKCAYPQVVYLLGKDILRHHRLEKDKADFWAVKGSRWADNNIKVTACGSNDSGVSWIVEVEGKLIFHAGDLNNWYVSEGSYSVTLEKQYLGELKDIGKIASSFDVVMFPVDARIGNGYTRGGRQFLEKFSISLFVPMHFVMCGFESAWRFKDLVQTEDLSFWYIRQEGDVIEI